MASGSPRRFRRGPRSSGGNRGLRRLDFLHWQLVGGQAQRVSGRGTLEGISLANCQVESRILNVVEFGSVRISPAEEEASRRVGVDFETHSLSYVINPASDRGSLALQ